MASEWAYKIARNQLRTVEAMANNLDGAHMEGVIEGRMEGLEEAAKIVEVSPKTLSATQKIRKLIEEMKR